MIDILIENINSRCLYSNSYSSYSSYYSEKVNHTLSFCFNLAIFLELFYL